MRKKVGLWIGLFLAALLLYVCVQKITIKPETPDNNTAQTEDPVTPGHPPGAPRERCPVRIELFSGGGKATEEWYTTVP